MSVYLFFLNCKGKSSLLCSYIVGYHKNIIIHVFHFGGIYMMYGTGWPTVAYVGGLCSAHTSGDFLSISAERKAQTGCGQSLAKEVTSLQVEH